MNIFPLTFCHIAIATYPPNPTDVRKNDLEITISKNDKQ